MFEYFDIHSHLYFPDYDTDREDEIAKIKNANIGTITIGTDRESSQKAIDLAHAHDNLFACVGFHPGDVGVESVYDSEIETLANDPRVVAIGECGLDYFRLDGDAEKVKVRQKNIFESHIDLSLRINKPLMLHIRAQKDTYDAYADALDILEHHAKQAGSKLRGNAHFFAGDMKILKRFLDIGFTVSFTGVITFTTDYDEYVRYTPLHMIMSETDAPFVAPVPYRRQRNSPLYVPEVVKKIADIRGESFEYVRKTLVQNAINHFNLL
jgi:TatD DNase family protein